MNKFEIRSSEKSLNEAFSEVRRGRTAYLNVLSFDSEEGSVQLFLEGSFKKGHKRIELDLFRLAHNFSQKGMKHFQALGYRCTLTGIRRDVEKGSELAGFEVLFEDVRRASPDCFEKVQIKR